MENPKLSTVLISKQDSQIELRKTLKSVLNQTYKNIEILIVNANEQSSYYNEILREVSTDYPNIRLLEPDWSGTIAQYRNFAIASATGEYLAFIDVPDQWQPGKAQIQIQQLARNGFAASCANGLIHYPQAKYLNNKEIFPGSAKDIVSTILHGGVEQSSQLVYRTSVLVEVQGFSDCASKLVDLEMVLRLQKEHFISLIQQPLFTSVKSESRKEMRYGFHGRQMMMPQHTDFFLAHPQLSARYCLNIGIKALASIFLGYGVYFILLAFFYAPLFTIPLLVGGMLRLVKRNIWWGLLELKAVWEGARLLKQVKRGVLPVLHGPPITDMATESQVSPGQFQVYAQFQFAFQQNLIKVVVPEGVKVIRRGMFFKCENLEEVVLPSTVVRLEARAFQNCINLKRVRISPGSDLESIGRYCFAGCRSLQTLTLPDSMTRFGEASFLGCSQLRTVTFSKEGLFPRTIANLPAYVFAGCEGLESVEFQANGLLAGIAKGAFLNCKDLRTFRSHTRVKVIGASAFGNCLRLEHFDLPLIDVVESIGKYAFYNCKNLARLHIPNALTEIRRGTYAGCEKVTHVIVPSRVRKIENKAFDCCKSLKRVVLTSEFTSFGRSVFPPGVPITIQDSNMLEQEDK